MLITTDNDWELSDKSGLVSVGSHSLFISTGGPPRKPSAPVIIFITGGGVPTEFYIYLQRSVSKFTRNYFYDRAGYGRSEPYSDEEYDHDDHAALTNEDDAGYFWWAPGRSTVKRSIIQDKTSRVPRNNGAKNRRKISASENALELHRLMQAINVQSPYILAAHSYGGIVARTYYALYPDDVAGLALLDTNSELLQQCLSPIPPLAYQKVTADVDLDKITRLREKSGMTDEEWEAAIAAVERTNPTNEATHGSGRQLARWMQVDQQVMGDSPLIVTGSQMVHEWRLVFEEGKRIGGGTRAERREAEWWVESAELFTPQVQRVQMGLSRKAEFIDFEDIGHAFPITAPNRTAEVIRKLLSRLD